MKYPKSHRISPQIQTSHSISPFSIFHRKNWNGIQLYSLKQPTVSSSSSSSSPVEIWRLLLQYLSRRLLNRRKGNPPFLRLVLLIHLGSVPTSPLIPSMFDLPIPPLALSFIARPVQLQASSLYCFEFELGKIKLYSNFFSSNFCFSLISQLIAWFCMCNVTIA